MACTHALKKEMILTHGRIWMNLEESMLVKFLKRQILSNSQKQKLEWWFPGTEAMVVDR